MLHRTGRMLLAVTVAAAMTACGTESSSYEASQSYESSAQAASKKKDNLKAFAGRPTLIHGVAGDTNVVFTTESLAGRVPVLDRRNGQEIAVLPAPEGGFLLPFSVRVPRPGRLVLLDSGGFPNPAVPSIAKVYDYDYTYNERTGQFSATLVRTVSFEGLPVVFAEDVEVTDEGVYVVSEAVIGALWVIDQNGVISPGIFPENPAIPIPELGPCYFEGAIVDGIPFVLAGAFGPGANALTSFEGNVYVGGVCPGGLHRVPVASLLDTSRTPAQRAADIQVVSPKPAGAVVDAFEGLAVNRWDKSDRHIYASDSFNVRILRIDPDTGEREILATDGHLLNFPVGMQFLPPLNGNQPNPLLIANDQEHRLAALNIGITEDQLTAPWLISEYYPKKAKK